MFGVCILGTGAIAADMMRAVHGAGHGCFVATVGSRDAHKAASFIAASHALTPWLELRTAASEAAVRDACAQLGPVLSYYTVSQGVVRVVFDDDSASRARDALHGTRIEDAPVEAVLVDNPPPPMACGSYREAMSHANVAGVYVSVPTAHEEPVVLEAIALGKHVLADKPFAGAASWARMAAAAKAKGVLLMDATHFVHNPRTSALREHLRAVPSHTLTATFVAPSPGAGNIRHQASLEPMGAVGDLGWYTARAALEYLCHGDVDCARVLSVRSVSVAPSGDDAAVLHSQSLVTFANGTTFLSNVSLAGPWQQTLALYSPQECVRVEDFVLDHVNSGIFRNPSRPLCYSVHSGTQLDPVCVTVPVEQPAYCRMFARFAIDSRDPRTHASWAARTLATQRIVDSMFFGKPQ